MRKQQEACDQHSHPQIVAPESLSESAIQEFEWPPDNLLFRFYSKRFKSLEATISSITSKINSDELIDILRQDPVSEGFTVLRINEIIQECMQKDREGLIAELAPELKLKHGESLLREKEYLKKIEELNERIADIEKELKETNSARMTKPAPCLEDDIEKFKLKLKEKENAMKATVVEVEAHQRNMELKNDLERQKSINNGLQSDLNSLKIEMRTMKDQVEESQRLLEALEDENNSSLSRIKYLQDQLEKVQAEKEYHVLYAAQIEENFKAQMFEIRENLNTERNEAINRVKQKYKEINKSLKAKNEEIIDSIEKMKAEREAEKEKFEKSLSELQKKLQESEEKSKILEEQRKLQIKEIETEAENLKKTSQSAKETLEGELNAAKNKLKEKETTVPFLQQEIKKKDDDHRESSEKLRVLEDKFTLLQKTYEATLKLNDKLNHEKSDLLINKSTIESTLREKEEKVSSLEKIIVSKERVITEKDKQMAFESENLEFERKSQGSYRDRMNVLEQTMHQQMEEIEKLSDLLKKAGELNNNFEKRLLESERQREETERKSKELRRGNEHLKQEIEENSIRLIEIKTRLQQFFIGVLENVKEEQNRLKIMIQEKIQELCLSTSQTVENLNQIYTLQLRKERKNQRERYKRKLEERMKLKQGEFEEIRENLAKVKSERDDFLARNLNLERENESNKSRIRACEEAIKQFEGCKNEVQVRGVDKEKFDQLVREKRDMERFFKEEIEKGMKNTINLKGKIKLMKKSYAERLELLVQDVERVGAEGYIAKMDELRFFLERSEENERNLIQQNALQLKKIEHLEKQCLQHEKEGIRLRNELEVKANEAERMMARAQHEERRVSTDKNFDIDKLKIQMTELDVALQEKKRKMKLLRKENKRAENIIKGLTKTIEGLNDELNYQRTERINQTRRELHNIEQMQDAITNRTPPISGEKPRNSSLNSSRVPSIDRGRYLQERGNQFESSYQGNSSFISSIGYPKKGPGTQRGEKPSMDKHFLIKRSAGQNSDMKLNQSEYNQKMQVSTTFDNSAFDENNISVNGKFDRRGPAQGSFGKSNSRPGLSFHEMSFDNKEKKRREKPI